MLNGFKKITALLMAVLMLLAALPAGAVGTEQYSNQVLPGISLTSILPSDTAVATYVFKKGDEVISTQSIKNGETLVEPEVTTGSNEKFVGWDHEVSFGTPITVEKNETITVNAIIEKVYHVFFTDSTGRVVVTREGKTGDTISGFDDITSTASTLISLQSDEGISGWQDADGKKVESVTLANSDVTLTAIIENGYWITFDSNGGSYVAPMFFAAGTTAAAPANPTKPGFTFDDWYTDEDLTTLANFGNIKTNKILYADWKSTQVSYTVIHWWENANDDGYSYHEMETKYGNAGELTSAAGKTYTISGKNLLGEDVSDKVFTAKAIEQQTIKGDGSTIVNVYYERKQYTLHFKEKQNSWNDEATITKKWGADISKDEWPTYTINNWNQKENSNWQIVNGQGSNAYLAYTSTMPMMDGKLWKTEAQYVLSAQYMVESLDGKTYILHHTDTIYGDGNTVGEEDKYAITGFTFSHIDATKKYDVSWNGSQTWNGKYYYNGAIFYYTRNSYYVVYHNGTTVAKEQPYKYEEDISQAGDYKPANPPTGMEGYVFDGWYADPTYTVKYVFDGKTMPANNIIVYAKWVPPVYTVTVYDSDKTTVLKPFKDIPKGDTISEADMPLNEVNLLGGQFLGWVDMDTNNPFRFDTQITKDYRIYAKVGSMQGYTVAYDANGGSNPPTDNNTYAVDASAVVLGKGDMSAPADNSDKSTFLGWAKTATATEPDYLPGQSMVISAADANENNVITLYAVWGPTPSTTTLTYNANYTGADPMTVTHTENGSTELPNNATVTLYGATTFTRTGYTLVGWSKTAGENATKNYDLGVKVIVDNKELSESTNVLYAVWERTTVTLTIKKVVEGVTNEDSFTFNVSYKDGDASTSTNVSEFTLKNGETQSLANIPVGATLTITESGATTTNYDTTATYGNTTVDVTDSNGTKTITGITVNETDKLITVTNKIKTGKLTISKVVTGGWGDKTKQFTFTLKKGNETLGTIDLSNNGVYTHTTEFPYGTEVIITENDYTGVNGGYTTSYVVKQTTGNANVGGIDADNNESSTIVSSGNNNSATVTIGAPETTVTFTNHKDATTPTGVLLDSLPYILILVAIAAVVGVVIVRRRRNRDDD